MRWTKIILHFAFWLPAKTLLFVALVAEAAVDLGFPIAGEPIARFGIEALANAMGLRGGIGPFASITNALIWAGGGIAFGTFWLWQAIETEQLEERAISPAERLAIRRKAGGRLSAYGDWATLVLLAAVPVVYFGALEGHARTALAAVVAIAFSLGAFVDFFTYSSTGQRWGMPPIIGRLIAESELKKDLKIEQRNRESVDRITAKLMEDLDAARSSADVHAAVDRAVDSADKG